MSALAEIDPDLKTTEAVPLEDDYLASIESQLKLPPSEEPVADALPVPDATEPEVPVTEKAPEKASRPEAERRIKDKQLSQEVEALRKELEELRPLRDEKTKLETELTEHKTLAEQKAARAEEIEKAYRNEAEVLPDAVIHDVPEVRQAREEFEKATFSLFPKNIGDPQANEPVRPFSVRDLSPTQFKQIADLTDRWETEQFISKADPATRADIQHVVVSNIARIIGVNPDGFTEKTIGGSVYNVIPPSHPVYQHIANQMMGFVESRQKLGEVQKEATTNVRETLAKSQRVRVLNSEKMFRDMGVTLSGDDLKSALSAAPDNELLKTVALLETHPDLMTELKNNASLEAMVNGHLRPQLDIAETDPAERTKKGNMLMARVGLRAVAAITSAPLQKLALRQESRIKDLETKLALAEKEAGLTREQAEAGSVVNTSSDTGKDQAPDSEYSHLFGRLGLNK